MAQPGVREKVYLGGIALVAGPSAVTPTWLRAQTRDRARDGSLYVDSLQPQAGYPVILSKLSLALSWASMCSADIARINALISYGGPIDVCLWQLITEAWYVATGVNLGGSLLRRNALTTITGGNLPPNAATNYPVTPLRGSGASFTATLGTPDATTGVTPWTSTVASSGETCTISYAPVFRMYVGEAQESFPQESTRAQTLVLEEM